MYRLVLPGQMSQKAGQRDKRSWTGASKSGHKNTVKPMKTQPDLPLKSSWPLWKEFYTIIPVKTKSCLKQNLFHVT